MNITISLEELKKYQKDVEAWVESQAKLSFALKAIEHPSNFFEFQNYWKFEIERLETKLKEHPMPKLIPVV